MEPTTITKPIVTVEQMKFFTREKIYLITNRGAKFIRLFSGKPEEIPNEYLSQKVQKLHSRRHGELDILI